MMKKEHCILLLLTINLSTIHVASSWQILPSYPLGGLSSQRKYKQHTNDNPKISSFWKSSASSAIDATVKMDGQGGESRDAPPCYYKSGNRWKQRIQLDELKVGQKIMGERIGNADLLNAKTGPKGK